LYDGHHFLPISMIHLFELNCNKLFNSDRGIVMW
jgi:hypothetical protein